MIATVVVVVVVVVAIAVVVVVVVVVAAEVVGSTSSGSGCEPQAVYPMLHNCTIQRTSEKSKWLRLIREQKCYLRAVVSSISGGSDISVLLVRSSDEGYEPQAISDAIARSIQHRKKGKMVPFDLRAEAEGVEEAVG